MIATHNIKVNGRWIKPGEEYGVEKKAAPKKVAETVNEPEEKKAEVPVKEEPKPKPVTRRKVSK